MRSRPQSSRRRPRPPANQRRCGTRSWYWGDAVRRLPFFVVSGAVCPDFAGTPGEVDWAARRRCASDCAGHDA